MEKRQLKLKVTFTKDCARYKMEFISECVIMLLYAYLKGLQSIDNPYRSSMDGWMDGLRGMLN